MLKGSGMAAPRTTDVKVNRSSRNSSINRCRRPRDGHLGTRIHSSAKGHNNVSDVTKQLVNSPSMAALNAPFSDWLARSFTSEHVRGSSVDKVEDAQAPRSLRAEISAAPAYGSMTTTRSGGSSEVGSGHGKAATLGQWLNKVALRDQAGNESQGSRVDVPAHREMETRAHGADAVRLGFPRAEDSTEVMTDSRAAITLASTACLRTATSSPGFQRGNEIETPPTTTTTVSNATAIHDSLVKRTNGSTTSDEDNDSARGTSSTPMQKMNSRWKWEDVRVDWEGAKKEAAESKTTQHMPRRAIG